MNLLQLTQALQLECGVSGTLTTAQNQTGSLGRLVSWIQTAWLEVQTQHDDWEFMRSSNLDTAVSGAGISFQTVAGQPVYALGSGGGGGAGIGQFIIAVSQIGGSGGGTALPAPAIFGKWVKDAFRCQVTSAGHDTEIPMDWVTYDIWRDVYMLGAMRDVQTRPVVIAIGPNKELCLGPPPDGTYTVTGDFYLAPTQMSADTDVPIGLPAQFHRTIVYLAMQSYASYESAPEVMGRGTERFDRLMRQMEALYLPDMFYPGALC